MPSRAVAAAAASSAALAALAAVPAAASSGPVRLRFGQDVNYPPYAFRNATTGELAGFGKDIADGMNAICDDIEIEVVETRWEDCWTSQATLGALLANGTLDACMTYTHTQGVRNEFAEFSYAILEVNKAAGLLTLLDEDGQPRVDGHSDLSGLTVVDVGGWAPTADGLQYVRNRCTGEMYSGDYHLIVGDGNDESLRLLRSGAADAMFVYADQAYLYQCRDGVDATWNCSLWEGFGTEYAYVQTGQFGYVVNGTTLAMSRLGSGVAAQVNPCMARFMETEEYYQLCEKYGLVNDCYHNDFFPAGQSEVPEYNLPTEAHAGDCSDGYCPCPAAEPESSRASGGAGAGLRWLLAGLAAAAAAALRGPREQ